MLPWDRFVVYVFLPRRFDLYFGKPVFLSSKNLLYAFSNASCALQRAKLSTSRRNGYAVIDHRSFKARGIERIPTIHEGYASREMEKRGGRGDLCEENRRIQALNRLLDALRAMIGRLSDQAQGILTAVKRRQRPSGAPQAPSSPEPAERPQERPQARETPPQAPQEPPKPIRTKKALTDRFKTRLDERLAENERKQAEKQAEPDMEETWDLSDPADPLNIGMGWGTGGHGLGL